MANAQTCNPTLKRRKSQSNNIPLVKAPYNTVSNFAELEHLINSDINPLYIMVPSINEYMEVTKPLLIYNKDVYMSALGYGLKREPRDVADDLITVRRGPNGGSLTLSYITISGDYDNRVTGTLIALENGATLTLNAGAELEGNFNNGQGQHGMGGAVRSINGGKITMNKNSAMEFNYAQAGGAIYVPKDRLNTVYVNDFTKFRGNEAEGSPVRDGNKQSKPIYTSHINNNATWSTTAYGVNQGYNNYDIAYVRSGGNWPKPGKPGIMPGNGNGYRHGLTGLSYVSTSNKNAGGSGSKKTCRTVMVVECCKNGE